MQEQLITFETAKLAKLKGFQDNNQGYYVPMYDGNGVLVKEKLGYQNDWLIVAPTQSLLQTWLRKIHDLDIMIKKFIGGGTGISEVYIGYVYRIHSSESDFSIDTNFVYDTYEYALEAILKIALNLIK
jgi:hypothetical protein